MPGTIKYKIFDSEVKAFDENDLTVEHFISTERRDRENDVMLVDGMKIKGKPVVLLMHGRTAIGSEPIAKPLWIKKGTYKNKKGIVAKTKFFDDEQGIGRRLWQKTKDGFMPNWSIGYDILDYTNKRDYTEIRVWDLLEYSLVGVPMNPDAQTIYSKSYDDLETVYEDITANIKEDEKDKYFPAFRFVLMDEENNQDEKDIGEKPYENEHSCRIVKKDWDRVSRENNKFGQGIHAIFGIKNDTAELASIRFDSSKFSADEARKWCSDHDHKCNPFEPAKQKEIEQDQEALILNFKTEINKYIFDEFTNLRIKFLNYIDNKIDERLTKEGLIKPLPGDPAPEEKGDDKNHDENPRPMKLVIKPDQDELLEKQREDNAKALAEMIAGAIGSSFKQGIRRLLGKVD